MDQLKYSLRSVEMYIPWARHVYIVTNGQGMDFVLENIFGVKIPGKRRYFHRRLWEFPMIGNTLYSNENIPLSKLDLKV